MFWAQVNYYLKNIASHDQFSGGMRVFIALFSVWLFCAYLDRFDLMTPLFLGVMASVLVESEDYWRGRIISLGVNLLCFTLASLAVELLFAHHLLFIIALIFATFSLIMLGAIGARYATIAQATLVLAVYSMLGVDTRQENIEFWQQPLFLVGSGAWYGLISVIWSAAFSHQSVQHNLAHVYFELSVYLRLKAALFDPRHDLNVRKIRIKLAQQNSKIIEALNKTRDSLHQRMGKEAATAKIKRYLKLHFIAQDIHERTSASHYPYLALAEEFFHSDVLYRAKRLLKLQAKACKKLSAAIRLQNPYIHADFGQKALIDLQNSLEFIKQLSKQPKRALRRALQALAANLSAQEQKFIEAADPNTQDVQDTSIRRIDPHNLRESFKLVRKQCTFSSLLFRYAVRKSLALAAGYALLNVAGLEKGYWILLTIVFVCQRNYGETLQLLGQRISGTILGIALAWALFRVFPSLMLQSILAIIAGVIFFIKKEHDKRSAAIAMTLLASFCFNQIGDSHALFMPRLLDTIIGCVISALAVVLIVPDWRGRKLNTWFIDSLRSNSAYLAQILQQYQNGKKEDDLNYRVARREAHNAEVALASKISAILLEPKAQRKNADSALRFLAAANDLLAYISALATQRDLAFNYNLFSPLILKLMQELNNLAVCLENKQIIPEEISLDVVNVEELNDNDNLIFTNLELITKQLNLIREIINDWHSSSQITKAQKNSLKAMFKKA